MGQCVFRQIGFLAFSLGFIIEVKKKKLGIIALLDFSLLLQISHYFIYFCCLFIYVILFIYLFIYFSSFLFINLYLSLLKKKKSFSEGAIGDGGEKRKGFGMSF